MKKTIFLLPLLLWACAHAQPDHGPEDAAAIAQLTLPEAKAQLATEEKEISDLAERVRSAETRMEYFRLQVIADPNKQGAVDGAEAELASLQAKKTATEHRRHLLEGRMRELNKSDTQD